MWWISTVITFLVTFENASMVSLQGPPRTVYYPCGLGLTNMEKVFGYRNMTNVWQAIVNFDLYPGLNEAKLKIVFENPVILLWTSQNDSIDANATRVLMLKIKDNVPKHLYLDIKIVENNSVPIIKNLSLNDKELCNEQQRRSLTEALKLTSPDNTTSTHVCGRRTLEHTELMTVNAEAALGQWPWHVVLLITVVNQSSLLHRCGGSIVSRTAILSAAHCLHDGNVIEARRVTMFAGVIDLKQLNKSTTQMLQAEKIIIHPGYKKGEATLDLSIVRVNKIMFNEYVQPICLWGPSFEKTGLYGLVGTVMGFGRTENKTFSNTLRSTRLKVQRDEECIAQSPVTYTRLLTEFSFCTGNGSGINVLEGDSGGGFIVPVVRADHKISWTLRGVCSMCLRRINETLCDERFYTIFTDVSPHYPWIFHHAGLRFTTNIL